ncbi:tRNA-binding protein [Solimonas fluminis]|uniref:tRNA-binding protein n=1 Tax=Solimonas fluminis TaxID=2086571 RepID=A0A2S5TFE7_9GAMM|nr:tRNA-binding protein [Solimonas fluminis]PPE73710.1 tRNA-binding protein [Solimonas fluminis]
MVQHIIDTAGQPYAPEKWPRKPDCGSEGFLALDLRVGTVLSAEPFAKARKPAWQLRVDFGPAVGVLQTSAQVTNYPAESLVGRRVVGAINLGEKRIAGFTSQFLVLGALLPDGTVNLLAPDGEPPDGALVA